MTRVGILGGTFDPVHLGHLAVAQFALEKMKLDQVIFVPSYFPPHKNPKVLTSAVDRLKMVQLATKSNPHFRFSDFEVKRNQKSYSIDTIKYFVNKYPHAKLFFIIGADAFKTLETWKNVEDLLTLVTFVVVNRPGYNQKNNLKGKFSFLEMPPLDISSSYLRQRVAENKSIQYFVPDRVMRYIEKKALYNQK